MTEFGDHAKGLSRNPVGIIALFIVLVDGFASLVVMFGGNLTAGERAPLIWFMILFPTLVMVMFAWLVVNHHEKLYSPSDFKDEKHFFELKKSLSGEVTQEVITNLRGTVEELKIELKVESAMFRMQSCMNDGRWEEARRYADNILEQRRDSSVYIHSAYIARRLDNLEKAVEELDKAIAADDYTEDKDRMVVYFNRACYRSLLNGDKEDIFADLVKVVEMDKQYLDRIRVDADLSPIANEFIEFYTGE